MDVIRGSLGEMNDTDRQGDRGILDRSSKVFESLELQEVGIKVEQAFIEKNERSETGI